MSKQTVIPRSEIEEELAAMWGAAPDVSKIFDLSDTPKPKVSVQSRTVEDSLLELLKTPPAISRIERSHDNPKRSELERELERLFAASIVSTSPSERSPVKSTLDSIAKVKALLGVSEQDLDLAPDPSFEKKPDPEEIFSYNTRKEKERPHINRGPIPYSWETKKW
jgi:hypothetical protein